MEWLRAKIESEFVVERDGWAAERVSRVTERLQHDSAEAERLETIVVWWAEHTAFTTPGRTIYFSRRLLERLPDDDATAFVIAHELAHHRLGHIPRLSQRWHVLPVQILVALLQQWIAGPGNERDADLVAIELCIAAGFDAQRCIAALELLDHVVLDYGHVDESLGPEHGNKRGSHPAVRHRIEDLHRHVVAMQSGHRLEHELASRRGNRRRRAAWIAAGATGAAVALLLLRRRPKL